MKITLTLLQEIRKIALILLHELLKLPLFCYMNCRKNTLAMVNFDRMNLIKFSNIQKRKSLTTK